jgi:hypothetical protein
MLWGGGGGADVVQKSPERAGIWSRAQLPLSNNPLNIVVQVKLWCLGAQ